MKLEFKRWAYGTSLVVQWLRLCTSTADPTCLVAWQKKKKKKKIKKVEPGDGEIPDAIIEVPETKSISGLFFLPSFFFFSLFSLFLSLSGPRQGMFIWDDLSHLELKVFRPIHFHG